MLSVLIAQLIIFQQGFASGIKDEDPRPFRIPFAGDPSPDTWLFIQPYGNTFFAYQYRRSVYYGGQGLHFGIDLAAACGTPVLAIGDGVVESVDSWHGAGPHNLMITHPNGYDSFYGHLLVRPRMRVGQVVEKGEIVALSGDPDLTCNSRPHLHLEIRDSETQGIAYNPLELIEADWERIALSGAEPVKFVQELGEPRRWVGMLDQPETKFGYPLVNEFSKAWPYDW
ncbi:MAG: M23 family metallopeptidase [Anaerolineales bacterium]|jgi:murein DD-endopeptidase MepM/ murein hydrolase activator NlpD